MVQKQIKIISPFPRKYQLVAALCHSYFSHVITTANMTS